MRPDGESRQGRRNTTCIQQHMRTNLRTESGRYGCRSRVICCRISIPPCIRPKKQRTFGSQVPTAASGKNRNSLSIRRADRPYPCGFCGGSLCANSGHWLSTTARISSEIWSMCSISINDRDRVVVLVGHVEDLARLILREQLPRSGTAKRMQKPRFRLRPREHRRRARLA